MPLYTIEDFLAQLGCSALEMRKIQDFQQDTRLNCEPDLPTTTAEYEKLSPLIEMAKQELAQCQESPHPLYYGTATVIAKAALNQFLSAQNLTAHVFIDSAATSKDQRLINNLKLCIAAIRKFNITHICDPTDINLRKLHEELSAKGFRIHISLIFADCNVSKDLLRQLYDTFLYSTDTMQLFWLVTSEQGDAVNFFAAKAPYQAQMLQPTKFKNRSIFIDPISHQYWAKLIRQINQVYPPIATSTESTLAEEEIRFGRKLAVYVANWPIGAPTTLTSPPVSPTLTPQPLSGSPLRQYLRASSPGSATSSAASSPLQNASKADAATVFTLGDTDPNAVTTQRSLRR